MNEEHLQNLNDPQQEAVLHTQGPLLVLAGAGSGKTRVITSKIAHLIAQNVPPWHILAVTFTNKASEEMQTRVDALTTGHACLPAGRAGRPLISTFHRF